MADVIPPVRSEVANGLGEGKDAPGLPWACNALVSCLLPTLRQLHWARIHHVSPTGIRLLMDQAFSPDTPLVIQLKPGAAALLAVPARVADARLDPSGNWIVGCQFESAVNLEKLAGLG